MRTLALAIASLTLIGTPALARPGEQPAPIPPSPTPQPTALVTPVTPVTIISTVDLVAPDELVTVQRGTLPIILSAPHGGGARIPGAIERHADGDTVTVRDSNSERLALLIAQRLTERLGEKPSYVIAQFSRHDVDANRPPEEAFLNDAAKRHYDAYHRALGEVVRAARDAHAGRAVLIDIHGQSRDKSVVFRGTRNGASCKNLLDRAGRDAFVGPQGLQTLLKRKGFKVEPGTPSSGDKAELGDTWRIGREKTLYGGYIVARYGSQGEGNIDAIQLEFGDQREDEDLVKTSREVGDALAEWVKAYFQ